MRVGTPSRHPRATGQNLDPNAKNGTDLRNWSVPIFASWNFTAISDERFPTSGSTSVVEIQLFSPVLQLQSWNSAEVFHVVRD